MKGYFLGLLLLVLILPAGIGLAAGEEPEVDGGFFTVYNEQGEVILTTGHTVVVGDEWIDEDNTHYRVVKVEGFKATAEKIGQIDLSSLLDEGTPFWAGLLRRGSEVAQTNEKPRVAIYHTHSDESYEPSDGTASTDGRGGVYKVGATLVENLRQIGIEAVQSQNNHNPHDAGAYDRSRPTVEELLKQNPTAVFDVHRDALPRPEEYLKEVDGTEIAQVMLVVGRQNQQVGTILDFAKKVKAAADSKKPGLVRGIFMAKGNYNQDLFPRSLLLEFGSHSNTREDAEQGAAFFAEIVPAIIGAANAPERTGGQSFLPTIGWILVVLLFGAGAFLLISTGSPKEAMAKVRGFFGREFSDLTGKKPDDRDDG